MWKAICWFFTAYPTAHGALTRTIIMMCHLRWKLYLITNISIQFSQVIYNSTQDRSHLLIRIHLWLFCKHLCSYISEVSKIFCFFFLINETFPWAEHRLDTKPLQFCVWNLEEKKKITFKGYKVSQWKCADGFGTCSRKYNGQCAQHKWNVVVEGSSAELFNQYPRRQWGRGPLAPVSQAK